MPKARSTKQKTKRTFKHGIPNKVIQEIFPDRSQRTSPAKETYDLLRHLILAGKLKKGEKLIQNTVAEELGMSDTVVKVVFSRLRRERLIISRKGVGSVVK